MGLGRTAMPITVAAAPMCAPLAAQTRATETNPKRLDKAHRLAWLYNWYRAGPLYAEAEKPYSEEGDARKALWAKIGRLRSEWETMSFPSCPHDQRYMNACMILVAECPLSGGDNESFSLLSA